MTGASLLAFFIGSKLRAAITSVAAVALIPAIAFGGIQTLRIEGAICSVVAEGERPDCLFQGFKQRLAVVRIDLDHVRDLREADEQSYELGYQAAEAIAQGEKRAKEAADRLIKERTDHELQSLRAKYRNAVDRYADAHRVRREQLGQGSTAEEGTAGSADLPNAAGAAQGAYGSGDGAELVAIPRADLDTFVDNTARLVKAHEWATGPAFARPVPAEGER